MARSVLFLMCVGVLGGCGLASDPLDPGDPVGESIWESYGGFCDGPCEHRTLYMERNELELRHTKGDEVLSVSYGTLTTAGDDEYLAAGLEADDAVGMLHECSPADGIDARVVVPTEDGTTGLRYCILSVDPGVARLHAFFEDVMNGLDTCASNEWVDAC